MQNAFWALNFDLLKFDEADRFEYEGERAMKTLKIIVLIIVVWNIFVVVSTSVLDKIDPYYAVQQNEHELTEEELIAVCLFLY